MTERKPERKALGRGLSALMADVGMVEHVGGRSQNPEVIDVPIEMVRPNPDQPRRLFNKDQLEELTHSVREKGVLQPLLVRRRDAGYEIVAGERRWRAAQAAQLHKIPVLVRDYSDLEVLEVGIIENIQRADLSPVEEGNAYRQLIDRFGHTQDKLSEILGKSRSHIANTMRLLSLPDDVIGMMHTGALSSGHARALVGHPDAGRLARRVVDEGMTVRALEQLVRSGRTGSATTRAYKARGKEKDADTLALEADVSSNLGMSVKISHEAHTGTGVLSIRYNTLDDLDMLCRVLSAIRTDFQS